MPGHLRVDRQGLLLEPKPLAGQLLLRRAHGRGTWTVTTAVVVLPRRVAVWANRRALARNSLTGIEFACALCAAVWFSAGTPLQRPGRRRALGGGYLAGGWGQLTVGAFDGWLAAPVPGGRAGRYTPGWQRARHLGRPGLGPGHCGCATARDAEGGPAVPSGPLSGWSLRRRWTSRRWRPTARSAPWPSWPAACWGCPRGSGRAVITVTAALYGTRMSLLVITCWGAVALAWAVAGPRPGAATEPGTAGQPAAAAQAGTAPEPGTAPRRAPGPCPPDQTSPPRATTVRWPGSQARSCAASWSRCPQRWPG